jgi:glycopeptide antibiotics resistance protein
MTRAPRSGCQAHRVFRRHPVLAVLSLAYLGFVGWVTLDPTPPQPASFGLFERVLAFFARHGSTAWLTYDRVEFLANIALFVPIGVFVLLLFGRRWWWLGIAIGVLLTCGIEFTQQFLPERVPDVRDLIANSTGAAIGALGALVVTTPAAMRHARAQRAAAG